MFTWTNREDIVGGRKVIHNENFYQSILQNMLHGFSYHQVVLDENNLPVDYIFIEVNKAFEDITGLKKENILGKKVTEVLPGIGQSEFNWINIYGKIALSCSKEYFIQYSEELQKWYSVCACSHEKGFFATTFSDVTELKKDELELQKQNEHIGTLHEELVATEEELRQQLDELMDYNNIIKANKERFKRAQAISHVGNWELEVNNNMLWVSEEALKLFGFTQLLLIIH